jgi:hypothetical protein
MALIGFKKQFALLVETGKKTQTVRAPRKKTIKVGEILHCYTGLRIPKRFNKTKKLGEFICKSVEEIEITVIKGIAPLRDNKENYFENDRHKDYYISIRINGDYLNREQIISFTQDDGFVNVTDFGDFFHNREHKFKGQLIKW